MKSLLPARLATSQSPLHLSVGLAGAFVLGLAAGFVIFKRALFWAIALFCNAASALKAARLEGATLERALAAAVRPVGEGGAYAFTASDQRKSFPGDFGPLGWADA